MSEEKTLRKASCCKLQATSIRRNYKLFFTVILKRINIEQSNLFMRIYIFSVFAFVPVFTFAQPNPNKTAVIASVEKHQQELINLSDSVWKYAETALKEYKSSKALS